MKLLVTIFFLTKTLFLFGQGNFISQEDLAKLTKREVRNALPDSDYTTSKQDTLLFGQVLEVCVPIWMHFGGGSAGVIKIRPSKSDSVYQIIFTMDDSIQDLIIGQTLEFEVEPYSPEDSDFDEIGLSCMAIKRWNLFKLSQSL